MAITTVDGYIGAVKQRITWMKSASRTAVAASPFSVFDLAGTPGAGTLGGTSTTTGVVPTDATAGCPAITFSSGTGYLTNVQFNSPVAGVLRLYDVLWKAGAYTFNASTTGQTPTSFLSRIPGGTAADTAGCTEIWAEQVTAGTLVQNIAVTYNDEAGASSTTGTIAAPAAMIVGRMFQLPLASGDDGCSGVTGVVGSVASAGTFNILVMRPLWSGRIALANDQGVHGLDMTGMPIVFSDSAIFGMIIPDSTATSTPYMTFEIASA